MNQSIQLAVDYLQGSGQKPNTQEVVDALLAEERQSRKAKHRYQYDDLVGTWRLGFVSGTQTTESKSNGLPVKKPGKGRFIPSFTKIEITYKKQEETSSIERSNLVVRPNVRSNSVENKVVIGPLRICLLGPTLFKPALNVLAFDFTSLAVSVGSWVPYKGEIRGGQKKNNEFREQSLKEQAFFSFFLVKDGYIAARGKGGGLALWTRISEL